MKFNIKFKNFAPVERIRSLVHGQIAKLERKTRAFREDSVFLRILVEGNPARTLYHTSITLEVPGKTLATKEERHDLEVSIKDAFSEIGRQLAEHKSRLRGERFWNRSGRREQIRNLKLRDATAGEQDRDAFFRLVSPHLARLYHFVRHILRYSEQTGELVRGELSAEDVVDAALIRAHREFLQGLPRRDIRSWLIRIAIDQMDAEVNQVKLDHERAVHIEEDTPETPPTVEVSTLGDEIMDFYQPDEDLKVEDIIPDPEVPTPEQVTEMQEMKRFVRAALAEMPAVSRRVLLLRDVEGRPVAQVAKVVGRPETEVESILERARGDLRRKLAEYGYGVRRAA
jgi:RNA polymerase sigma-70 factor (ECF subfamily)